MSEVVSFKNESIYEKGFSRYDRAERAFCREGVCSGGNGTRYFIIHREGQGGTHRRNTYCKADMGTVQGRGATCAVMVQLMSVEGTYSIGNNNLIQIMDARVNVYTTPRRESLGEGFVMIQVEQYKGMTVKEILEWHISTIQRERVRF